MKKAPVASLHFSHREMSSNSSSSCGPATKTRPNDWRRGPRARARERLCVCVCVRHGLIEVILNLVTWILTFRGPRRLFTFRWVPLGRVSFSGNLKQTHPLGAQEDLLLLLVFTSAAKEPQPDVLVEKNGIPFAAWFKLFLGDPLDVTNGFLSHAENTTQELPC